MTTENTTLDQQLAEFDNGFRSQVPAEAVTIRQNSFDRITQSNLLKEAVKVGQIAPDFTLPNAQGQAVSLAQLLTKGPVVLVFYRGEWCPYCNLTLRAYQAALSQIEALGASLVAISPQTPDNSLTTVEKKELTFEVLSDQGNQVARNYGLVYKVDDQFKGLLEKFGTDLSTFNGDKSYELPASSTFVIEQSGKVRVAHITPDFTKRLDPSKVIETLRDIKQ